MEAIEIRLSHPSEASAIAEVIREAFAEYKASYTAQGFAATILSTEQVLTRFTEGPIWLAISDGEIIGTAAAVLKTNSLYIRSMAVLPLARGRQVGKLLLLESERYACSQNRRQLVLSTTPFLLPAIRLYEGFGFRRTDDGPHDLFGTPLFTMFKLVKADSKTIHETTRKHEKYAK